MLICAWSCCARLLSVSEVVREGVKLFASVALPAIDESGTPTLRGEGGGGCSVEGWYAVAVCICLFADCLKRIDDEKLRMHCGHWREALEGVANRRKAEDERASAVVVRGSDIFASREVASMLQIEKWCVMRVNGESDG